MRVCGRKSFIRLITFENLKQVLVFHQILFTMLFGEVKVPQDQMNAFLKAADDLKVK